MAAPVADRLPESKPPAPRIVAEIANRMRRLLYAAIQ
jgi:hypothetical protein